VIQDEELKFFNPSAVELTAYSLKELASISLAELVHPDDRAAGLERQLRRLGGEEVPPVEVIRIIDKQGNIKWVENNSILITWEGNPATLNFVNDVTERKQAEGALRQSEERHRALFETMGQGVLYWDVKGKVIAANPAAERILGLTLDQIQGKAPIDPRWKLIRQDGTEVLEEALPAIAALRSGEEMHDAVFRFFNPMLGSYRWVNVNAMPLLRPGEDTPYRAYTILEDITERIQAEAETRQRNEELAALNKIGQAIVSTLDLQETLTTITDYTTRLLSMAATSVILLDETNDDLYFAAASGEGAEFVVGQRLSKGQGVAGWVIENGQPALIPDVSQDDRWHSRFDTEGGFSTRSILCVPLKSKGRVIGALEAINKKYGFSQDDLHLLNALVASVATAIENARLFEQVRAGRAQLQTLSRRLVEMQEAERAHVARELHDETGQALSSMLLNLGLLEQEADQPDTVIARTNEMIVMVDDMLENLHRLAMNLRPATLDHLGLVPALEQYIETFNQQYPIKAQFEAVGLGEGRLPPEAETALYRIVQESLTNVLRHAQATQADVLVERRDDQVVVIVEDNGAGFDPETAMQTSRLGLLGMRERAEMLNGKLVIESAPGSGTTVLVEGPYETARSREASAKTP
jgi:PAS domain S-box-containing protein